MDKKTYSICYHGKKTDNMWFQEKRQILCAIPGKKADSMYFHGKKADTMCYHGKNAFLFPVFKKIMQRFRVAHMQHCSYHLNEVPIVT